MKKMTAWIMAALLLSACQSEDQDSVAANNTAIDPRPSAADGSGPAEAGETGTAAGEAGMHSEPVEATMSPEALQAAIDRAIAHPERPQDDVARDEQRHPDEILAFAGIEPGMRVLDLFTAGGYYTEILSRLMGADGEVWAQNPPQFYDRFGSADLDFRLADRRLPNVERQDRPLDNLALPSAYFDAVVAALVFHDFFWLTDDIPGLLDQVYAAMKPGGIVLITDHAAPEGTGAAYAMEPDNRHRIEAAEVRRLMEAAGFEFSASSDLLRNPDDDRSKAFFAPEMRGVPTDRFVHRYRKPG